MRWWIFTAVAALSVVISVTIALLWVRSYRSADIFALRHWSYGPRSDTEYVWSIASLCGRVRLQHQSDVCVRGSDRYSRPGFSHWSGVAGMPPFFGTRSVAPGAKRPGFMEEIGFDAANTSTGDPPEIIRGVIAPHWFIFGISVVAPALWVIGYRRRRLQRFREKRDLCIGCGYDLRASKEVCPECGRPVADPANA